MIKCETCGGENYPGALFCKECGHFLLQEVGQTAVQELDRVLTIHYLIPSSRRQGKLDVTDPIWVGRADPDHQFWPQLDLTGDGGVEMGVSRRHALIRKEEEKLVLVDKASVNGTWIDSERLVPDRAYALSEVTRVRFGRLPVQLFLE